MSENTKKEHASHLVTDEKLLYELASHNLLNKMCRVAANRYIDGARAWFFDTDPVVADVIQQYKLDSYNWAKAYARLSGTLPDANKKTLRQKNIGSDEL